MAQAHYDKFAGRYEGVMRPLEQWFLSELRRRTLRKIPQGAAFLEIGAGTGLNFEYYPYEARGVAGELSGEMLRIAREKSRPKNVCIIQNDAEELPFRNDSFDAVFTTLVLCSVSSPINALNEMRRVVRTGGTIVLLEHVRPAGLLGLFFDVLNLLTVPLFCDHVNRRTADLARAAGLEVKSEDKTKFGIINLITCAKP